MPGFKGIYEVTDAGNVISLRVGFPSFKNGKELSFSIRHGYSYVPLSKKRKRYFKRVHRIVAIAFIPNKLKLPYINHKNGIKTDNRVENLEWCTQKDNIRHAIEMGTWRNMYIKTKKQLVEFKKKNHRPNLINNH